jgi:hypothetical protein
MSPMQRMLGDVVVDPSYDNMNFLYGTKRLTVFSEIESRSEDLTDEEEDDLEVEEIANLALQLRSSSLLTSTTSNTGVVAEIKVTQPANSLTILDETKF